MKRLSVSGAFHTVQMEGAVDRLRTAIKFVTLSRFLYMELFRSAELRPAVMNVYSNYTGHIHAAKKVRRIRSFRRTR